MLSNNPDIEVLKALAGLQIRSQEDFKVVLDWLLDERASLTERMSIESNETLYRVQGAYRTLDTLAHCLTNAQEQVRLFEQDTTKKWL